MSGGAVSEAGTPGDALAEFGAAYGGTPALVASAPGRVNLIGEHTDYNGGEVLPIAIEQRTHVAVRPNGRATWRATSAAETGPGEFAPGAPRVGAWWDYVAGVVWALAADGWMIPPCDVAVASGVPAGAGLSSSAALEVATALALVSIPGVRAPECAVPAFDALARLSQWAEVEYVGVNSGIMDQFASALGARGQAVHVWCDTGTFEHVPMPDQILIFDTAVPRALRDSAYNARRAECDAALVALRRLEPALPNLAAATPELLDAAGLPSPLAERARHVVNEVARVRTVVAALKAGNALPGEVLVASHESLRDLYECSSPELDWFVEHALAEPGVRGARLTGAGWGGCAIAVGEAAALAAAAPRLAATYEARFGRVPRTWLTRAEAGAAVDVPTTSAAKETAAKA